MYSMMNIVVNMLLHIWKLPRVNLRQFSPKEKFCNDIGWWLDSLWCSFCNIYMYIAHYVVHLKLMVHQWYLKKKKVKAPYSCRSFVSSPWPNFQPVYTIHAVAQDPYVTSILDFMLVESPCFFIYPNFSHAVFIPRMYNCIYTTQHLLCFQFPHREQLLETRSYFLLILVANKYTDKLFFFNVWGSEWSQILFHFSWKSTPFPKSS